VVADGNGAMLTVKVNRVDELIAWILDEKTCLSENYDSSYMIEFRALTKKRSCTNL
jgi:hypothetical protein